MHQIADEGVDGGDGFSPGTGDFADVGARLNLSNSCAMRSLRSITSLKASAIFPAVPFQSSGRRTEKSPFFNATNALSKSRTLTSTLLASVWTKRGKSSFSRDEERW
jgi:hypothetical protein